MSIREKFDYRVEAVADRLTDFFFRQQMNAIDRIVARERGVPVKEHREQREQAQADARLSSILTALEPADTPVNFELTDLALEEIRENLARATGTNSEEPTNP
jgi:hypothetical protein